MIVRCDNCNKVMTESDVVWCYRADVIQTFGEHGYVAKHLTIGAGVACSATCLGRIVGLRARREASRPTPAGADEGGEG